MKRRLTSFILVLCMVVALIPLNLITANAATSFTIRTSKPSTSNKYYVNTGYSNGVNKCIVINSSNGYVLPNCVGYAWGRAYEAFGKKPTLSTGNADGWFSYNKNGGYYQYGSTPKAGSIACWKGGSYGHVAFVEKVDGSNVTITESIYGGTTWRSVTMTKEKMKTYFGYTLQGYIYVDPSAVGTSTHTLNVKYNGNGASIDCKQYVTAYALNLRSSYSTSSSQLTLIPQGKTITISETKTAGGYTWGKTTYDSKTGWCALSEGSDTYAYKRFYLNSNNVYLTKEKTVFTQALTQGVAKDLYNYTTFGLKKDGYSFVGWCAKADGSSTIFNQDDVTLKPETICSDVKTKDCTVTLYAIWRQNVKTVSNISVQTNPTKTTYYSGDKFDPTGVSVKVKYSDNSESVISQGLLFDYDFSNPGSNAVIIDYQGIKTSIEVTVLEPNVNIIEDSISLAVGAEKTASVSSNPDIEMSFMSADETVAKVESNGKIRGIANGTTEVVAEILYNDTFYSDTCTVIVGTGVKDQSDNFEDATIIVESKTSRSCETVSLSITLDNANTLKSVALSNIQFDADALELIEGQWKPEGAILSNVNIGNKTAVITFADNTDCNGELFVLTFRVKDNIADGLYSVSCDITAKHKSETGEKNVAISSIPGGIEVANNQKGDVNGDNEVSSDDAIQLLYYTLLPDLYPINQDGDFDGNGEVNSDDAIYLLYYTLLPDLYPLY